MGNEKAATQGVPANAEPVARGIDWRAIFRRRPDLAPPGYKEAFEAMRDKRSVSGGASAD